MNKKEHELNSEQIINYVISGIKNGVLAPGERLPSQRHIAEQFAVDRSVVRDAMKILEDRHYLTIKRGSGAYISPACLSRLSENYNDKVEPVKFEHIQQCASLIYLESMLQIAKNGSSADIDRLSAIVSSHYNNLSDKTPVKERFLYYFSFGTAVSELSCNPIFLKICTDLINYLGEIIMPLCMDIATHKRFVKFDIDIVDAIKDRDIDRVRWLHAEREYNLREYISQLQGLNNKKYYINKNVLLSDAPD